MPVMAVGEVCVSTYLVANRALQLLVVLVVADLAHYLIRSCEQVKFFFSAADASFCTERATEL